MISDRLLMEKSTQKHPRCAVLTCAVTPSCTYLLLAMQSLGADKCVDYKKENFEELYANDPFDVILDLIGGGLYRALVELKRALLIVCSVTLSHFVLGCRRWVHI